MSSFFPQYNVAQMDFADDDLVGLVSSERSTHSHSKTGSLFEGSPPASSKAHNIFDISAPTTYPSNNANNYQHHFTPPSHFNSTIPPLSHSHSHSFDHGAHNDDSRSRSRSRPPSIGPVRGRRGNSISSTSPPPQGMRPNIIIPSGRPTQASSPPPSGLSAGGWYIPPTPESLGNPHSLPYGDFSPTTPSYPPNGVVNGQDKQAILADEKRRRRRESHNAVERRRRDNINEKISELATLLPEALLEGASTNASGANTSSANSPPAPDELWGGLLNSQPAAENNAVDVGDVVPHPTAMNTSNGTGVIKANKGMILTKSVEYIRFLQQLVTAQSSRSRELENEIRAMRGEPLLPMPALQLSAGNMATWHSFSDAPTGPEKGDSAFSGSPLGNVLEEDEHEENGAVKQEEGSGEERRGRPRGRGGRGDMDIDE